MSVAVGAPSTRSPMPYSPVYRFSVSQYHRMIEAGVLTEHDRVELLEGWILPKMTHNPPHDVSVSLVQAEFLARVPAGWVVRIQSAITTPDSEPEPDAAVCRGPARRYVRSHPRPRDIGLLVEVADTTLAYDREFKGRLYARCRIPVYWVIDLLHRRIEVYTDPRTGKNPGYTGQTTYGITETVPVVIDGREIGTIPVRDLLP